MRSKGWILLILMLQISIQKHSQLAMLRSDRALIPLWAVLAGELSIPSAGFILPVELSQHSSNKITERRYVPLTCGPRIQEREINWPRYMLTSEWDLGSELMPAKRTM